LQSEILGNEPGPVVVADFGVGETHVVGKVSREPTDDDLSAQGSPRAPLDETLTPIRVGRDEQEADQHDRQHDENADDPRQNLQRRTHQNTWPNPI
jgi:hypothetical protein